MTNAERVAKAVTPIGACPGNDAAGGYVSSPTEAVMGITNGLLRIANALEDVAAAIRDGGRV
jgi:hypothetical protein